MYEEEIKEMQRGHQFDEISLPLESTTAALSKSTKQLRR